ncbi:DUF456 domain-containing protein [Micrococcus endophyticus]|uniref:DUF456 domain-containing protein n=1 Tax=Micrococcus endophyticus TaxID=455343 RepID=UPI0034CEC9C1
MTLAIAVSVLAVLLLIVGVVGTVYPILPGSALILITSVAWAWILGSGASWTFGLIAAGLAIAGMSASAVLTGRRLLREKVTRGPITWGVIGAIVGFFVIPIVGLFIGFAAGLFAAQWRRTRDARAALASSWGALKAMGLGMLVEFGCAMLALAAVGTGVLVHFLA